eukprot:TRINITY_DN824_c0_g1_i1.p1 TRINITY_DN824_c0_g1~~TRINITY_DN824_c0_g1_i1.p1  ORF type:complete len:471 (-),score=154.73 TRINITY_DN824_c0_g1_i1:386-1798(-)
MLRRGVKEMGSRMLGQMVARGMATGDRKLPPFDFKPPAYSGPSKAEVVETRKKYLNPAIFHYYPKDPLMVVDGKMQYLYDETGDRYLDLFAGIVTVSVGHAHPKVVDAGVNQMRRVMHTTTIYQHPEIAMYAKELAAKLPPHLDTIYFVNSGSEATDMAMLMARCYTGHYDLLALRNCYHGMGYNTMGVTALHTWRYPVPTVVGVKHVLNPNPYRGPFGYDDPLAASKYANDVQDTILHATSGRVAGFIAESIQGVGGTVVFPDGYLREVYQHVRNAGGVCIADEVQTGFGRMGTHFWGFECHGVSPDIVTMAKGIGNGIPLAAVATTKEIAATIAQRIHFNTYGGNPVSCAVGRATLKAIEEDGIQANALAVGNHFIEGLKALQKKHDIIGDVRGKGLMLGVELVKDRKTKEPAKEETARAHELLRDYKVLIGKGGLYGNVFRIKPPMCLSKADADYALWAIDEVLAKL